MSDYLPLDHPGSTMNDWVHHLYLRSLAPELPELDGPVTYFVQAGGDGGPVKIGRTRHSRMRMRLSNLQTSSAVELTCRLLIRGDFEGSCREIYEDAHIRGEWYEAWIFDDLWGCGAEPGRGL